MSKRILILTNHFFPEYFKINDISKWFHESNTVSVITGNPNYPFGKIYKGYSIFGSIENNDLSGTIYRLPLIPRGNSSLYRILLNYISFFISQMIFIFWVSFFHKKYDIIFIHHTSPPLIFVPAIFYKIIRKAKIILWDLDMWPHSLESQGVLKSKRINSLLEKIFKWFYKKFDFILIGSSSFSEIAAKRVNLKKVKYFPNWADNLFENNKIIPSYKSNDNKIIITYAGNIGESQGFEILIESLQKTNLKGLEFRLIGSGRFKNKLIKMVKNNQLEKNVRFINQVKSDELLKYFQQTHYFYLSLKNNKIFSKTVPAKLQTYLAVGKPIIASISGEANSILKKHKTGFQAKAERAKELSLIFNNLKNINKDKYEYYCFNCRKLYEKEFSSLNRKEQLNDLISKL